MSSYYPAGIPIASSFITTHTTSHASTWYSTLVKPVSDAVMLITGDPDWIVDTPIAPWVNFGGAFSPFAYQKEGGTIVRLKGFVKSGNAGLANPIYVLPLGYRPADRQRFIGSSSTSVVGAARIDVESTGEVYVGAYDAGAGNGFVDLGQVVFGVLQ